MALKRVSPTWRLRRLLDDIVAGVGGVSSAFGRTGAIVAVSGDYTSSLVTNSSGVAGATVTAALDQLDADIGSVAVPELYYVSLGDYVDLVATPPDDAADFTTALMAAWAAGGAIKPVFIPGEVTDIYRFTATGITDKTVEVFGSAAYRISETSYTPAGGAPITITNSLDYLYYLTDTPQYIYSRPNADGQRFFPFFFGNDIIDSFDPTHDRKKFVIGVDSGQRLGDHLKSGSGGILAVGLGALQNYDGGGEYVEAFGLNTMQKLRVANRVWGFFGSMQQALTYLPEDDGHDFADADLTAQMNVWIKDGGVAGSGILAYWEQAATAWVTAHAYDRGDIRVQGGVNYRCLIAHTSGTFATDLAALKWEALPAIVTTTFDGSGNYGYANIVVRGHFGGGRLPGNESDDATLITAISRDTANHMLQGEEVSLGGYANGAGPIEMRRVAGWGTEGFRGGNGWVYDGAWLGNDICDTTHVANRFVIIGGAAFSKTPSLNRIVAVGYKAGHWVGCGPDDTYQPLAWVTATAYIGGLAGEGNYVRQAGVNYRCIVSHTSGTFATDLAAGKWTTFTESEQGVFRLAADYPYADSSVVLGAEVVVHARKLLHSNVIGDLTGFNARYVYKWNVLGEGSLGSDQSTAGHITLIGSDAYGANKHSNWGVLYADGAGKAALSWDMLTGYVLIGGDPHASMNTASSANQMTKPLRVFDLAGSTEHFAIAVDGPAILKTFTVAGVPSAANNARGLIYVSNETGGAVIAFSDGTNWRRLTDRAIIS